MKGPVRFHVGMGKMILVDSVSFIRNSWLPASVKGMFYKTHTAEMLSASPVLMTTPFRCKRQTRAR